MLVLISSKNKLKANHNGYDRDEDGELVGFNIIKEQIESKSQHFYLLTHWDSVGFNIIKEQIESKSQLWMVMELPSVVGFNIIKEQIESKSQLLTVLKYYQMSWF